MRFLADMGVSPKSVEVLRTLGYDAIHLVEVRLHRLSDQEILHPCPPLMNFFIGYCWV
ncbi:MAG: DUF5615 family PIN-like protein [Caldilineaceae bacterium]|nr:DUF5615 family PIN-like protein [Caldilineaceae bacterium]